MPNYQGVWSLSAQYQAQGQGNWPLGLLTGDIAYVFSAYYTNSKNIETQYFASGGNTTYFGDITPDNYYNYTSALSNSVYGLLTCAGNPADQRNTIAYITLSTLGNTADWGDLPLDQTLAGTCANDTRGIVFGNAQGGNAINYITLASAGNGSDFGDALGNYYQQGSGTCSPTRGIFAIGYDTTVGSPEYATNRIEYLTIASTGNSSYFGDLTVKRRYAGAASSSTRGLFMGGGNNSSYSINIVDYVTIASTGNATDFGDMTVGRFSTGASNAVKAACYGGYVASPATSYNTIDYVTIASTGNATDFGDISGFTGQATACSNSHGGLA